MAQLKFTKIVNEEKQHERTHLKPFFFFNSKKRECNMVKKVKNKEQEACLKEVVVESFQYCKKL